MSLLLPLALATAIGFFHSKERPLITKNPLDDPKLPFPFVDTKVKPEVMEGGGIQSLAPHVNELPFSQTDPTYTRMHYTDAEASKPTNTLGDYYNVSTAPPWEQSLAPQLLPDGRKPNAAIPMGDWSLDEKLESARPIDPKPMTKLTRNGFLGSSELDPLYPTRTPDFSTNDILRKTTQDFVYDSAYSRHPHEGMLPGEVREWDDQIYNSSHELARFLRPRVDPPTERMNYMASIDRNPRAPVDGRQLEDPLSRQGKREAMAPNRWRADVPVDASRGSYQIPVDDTGGTLTVPVHNRIEDGSGGKTPYHKPTPYTAQTTKAQQRFTPTEYNAHPLFTMFQGVDAPTVSTSKQNFATNDHSMGQIGDHKASFVVGHSTDTRTHPVHEVLHSNYTDVDESFHPPNAIGGAPSRDVFFDGNEGRPIVNEWERDVDPNKRILISDDYMEGMTKHNRYNHAESGTTEGFDDFINATSNRRPNERTEGRQVERITEPFSTAGPWVRSTRPLTSPDVDDIAFDRQNNIDGRAVDVAPMLQLEERERAAAAH